MHCDDPLMLHSPFFCLFCYCNGCKLSNTARLCDGAVGATPEELEEIKRLEVEAQMKKEAEEKAELERQEAEEAEMRRQRHEEWVCIRTPAVQLF